MSFEGGERGAAVPIPQAQGAVPRPREEAPAGEWQDAFHRLSMSLEDGERGAALTVP